MLEKNVSAALGGKKEGKTHETNIRIQVQMWEMVSVRWSQAVPRDFSEVRQGKKSQRMLGRRNAFTLAA